VIFKRTTTVIASLGFAASLAACGSPSTAASSAQGSTGSHAASSTGPHEFKATLTVSGATKQTETFTENLSVLPACSVLAKTGAGGTWSLPAGGSTSFVLNWNVSKGFNGPGTYTDPADFEGSVELDANSEEFDPVPSSVLSVTVKPDGSGSATFQNLQDQYSQAAVNGTETWTCS
jgi:hypothetical protein